MGEQIKAHVKSSRDYGRRAAKTPISVPGMQRVPGFTINREE